LIMKKEKIIEAFLDALETERGQKILSDAIDQAMWRTADVEEFDKDNGIMRTTRKEINILDYLTLKCARDEGALRGLQEDFAKHKGRVAAASELIQRVEGVFNRFMELMNGQPTNNRAKMVGNSESLKPGSSGGILGELEE